jgi:uncharacterized protein
MRLSPAACRVLGSLAEKRLTTPDQYPLTVNALQSACNQRSARDPVMELSETDVQQGLRELREEGLARTSPVRGRVPRHEHSLDVQLDLTPPDQAVLGVLLLRGPQTVGEVRTRTDRWVTFTDLEATQAVLDRLAEHPFLPLVAELPREPGRRETRWMHLLGDPDAAAPPASAVHEAAATATPDDPVATPTAGALTQRVEAIEEELAGLRSAVEALRAQIAPIIEELG